MKRNPFLNEEMYRLHRLIKTRTTGAPAKLAKKLNCSESTIYSKIKALREKGFPIQYCKIRECYFYDGDVTVDFCVKINGEEAQKITGGNTINKINFFSSLQNDWS